MVKCVLSRPTIGDPDGRIWRSNTILKQPLKGFKHPDSALRSGFEEFQLGMKETLLSNQQPRSVNTIRLDPRSVNTNRLDPRPVNTIRLDPRPVNTNRLDPRSVNTNRLDPRSVNTNRLDPRSKLE